MNKDFLRGIYIALGIIFTFSFIGLVYAVGFHIAEEVLPGTFTGNYTFNGTITQSGGNTGSNPEPQLSFFSYFDNGGLASVSHLALFGTSYGFGISNGRLNIITNSGYDIAFMDGNETNMYIDDGYVGIGTTSPGNALDVSSSENSNWITTIENLGTTNAHGLYVNIGASSTGVQFRVDKGSSMNFQVANNGDVSGVHGTYHTASDRRLKTNISTLNNSLDKILNLRGVNYEWVDNQSGVGNKIGFISQEVEEILPEIVYTNNDTGYKSVHYERVTAILVEAIQEQQEQINSLTSSLCELNQSLEICLE